MGQMIDRLRGLADAGMSWLARSHRLWHRVLTPLHMGPIARRSDTWPLFTEPRLDQLARIGGSHAQREVFEDTMLEAYLRAEQFDKAEAMLRTRLQRRDSVRDLFWLGRAQVRSGQQEAARASLHAATQRWQDADLDRPKAPCSPVSLPR